MNYWLEAHRHSFAFLRRMLRLQDAIDDLNRLIEEDREKKRRARAKRRRDGQNGTHRLGRDISDTRFLYLIDVVMDHWLGNHPITARRLRKLDQIVELEHELCGEEQWGQFSRFSRFGGSKFTNCPYGNYKERPKNS